MPTDKPTPTPESGYDLATFAGRRAAREQAERSGTAPARPERRVTLRAGIDAEVPGAVHHVEA